MRRFSCAIVLFFLSLPVNGQTLFNPGYAARPDTVHIDSLHKDSLVNSPFDKSKIKIIKRDINTRRYVVLAIGMMVFLALILTTVQTWNPG